MSFKLIGNWKFGMWVNGRLAGRQAGQAVLFLVLASSSSSKKRVLGFSLLDFVFFFFFISVNFSSESN